MKNAAALVLSLLIAFTSGLNAQELKKNDRIVFLGDSITQAGARGNGYVRQIDKAIQAVYGELNVEIIGAGISGHKVPDCQKRLERDVLSKKPTIVFIYIGINDVWHWNRNRGTKKEDFDAGLRDMIAKIEAVGARVILCTPTVIGEKTDGTNKFDKMLDEYSEVSRAVAKDTGSQMLDLRAEFMKHLKATNKQNKDRGILTGDSVHLNGAGNTKVADLMLKALNVPKPKISLPNILSNHMLFQREKPIVIWGQTEAGATVTVTLGTDSAQATASATGDWKATLKAQPANATPQNLTITSAGEKRVINDVLIGDIWVGSGQSNMEWPITRTKAKKTAPPAANHPQIRLLHVPKVQTHQPSADVGASWKVCTPKTVPNFSAVLYHFGARLHKDVEVPIGLINSSWGGSPIEPWTVTEVSSGKMYNGMIAPLRNLAVKGCIWYQGETNVIHKNGLTYFDKKQDLINGWRKFWGKNMPFYFVHIAPWSGGKYEPGQLPSLWEGQTKTLTIPNTGMVVITDLVDNIKDIHPQNKTDVGNRLALWALDKTYGQKQVYSGPLFKAVKIANDKAILSFAHAEGLKSRDGKPLSEFKIAGADGKFVNAQAQIDGQTVVVSAEGVKPVTVQFGWHKLANPNLVNGAGLPAAPFQSNNWQGGTGE